MAKPSISTSAPRYRREPLYDFDPRTGAAIEVFYADDLLAKSFGTRPGWFWWSCRRGSLPDGPAYWSVRHELRGVPQRSKAMVANRS